jgi:hypothetical protein
MEGADQKPERSSRQAMFLRPGNTGNQPARCSNLDDKGEIESVDRRHNEITALIADDSRSANGVVGTVVRMPMDPEGDPLATHHEFQIAEVGRCKCGQVALWRLRENGRAGMCHHITTIVGIPVGSLRLRSRQPRTCRGTAAVHHSALRRQQWVTQRIPTKRTPTSATSSRPSTYTSVSCGSLLNRVRRMRIAIPTILVVARHLDNRSRPKRSNCATAQLTPLTPVSISPASTMTSAATFSISGVSWRMSSLCGSERMCRFTGLNAASSPQAIKAAGDERKYIFGVRGQRYRQI